MSGHTLKEAWEAAEAGKTVWWKLCMSSGRHEWWEAEASRPKAGFMRWVDIPDKAFGHMENRAVQIGGRIFHGWAVESCECEYCKSRAEEGE